MVEKKRSLNRFISKYTHDINSKDFPPPQKHVRLELQDSEYAKLFMMNNPVHDNDREKASSIAANIKINKHVLETNPFFQKMKINDKNIALSKKEMFR